MQKEPFYYALIRRGKAEQDLLFKRLYTKRKAGSISKFWEMHLDIDATPTPSVLIFVRGDMPRNKIMSEINRAQTYFREQTEERF